MSNQEDNTLNLIEQRLENNRKIIEETRIELEKIFPDPNQSEAVFSIYSRLFQVTEDIEELNQHHLYLSSYLDSFYTHLVGEGKIISEEAFVQTAQEAFKKSVDEIIETTKKLQEEGGAE